MQRLSAPQYFEQIRNKAAQRWDQLEADKELAGPWWQLFRQIQSPRHVLSELLQNADDAGAHSAEVRIEDGIFIFEHDGEDFTEEQFASLCRFGFSNKRHLHTIGFRGIGFKSTFSLGDVVELVTPTLSVRFLRHRFTEPTWIDTAHRTLRTRISVRLRDEQVRREIEKSLDEWADSTLSLLFFQSIRSLKINDYEIARTVIGEGPVGGSERIRLVSDAEQEIVRISSPLEDFPADAIEEIRQERMTVDPDFSLPPCRVEIVIGVPGEQRLYVVLPTDKHTRLPFSVNAPFVQDPARMGIKDPSISPTNRWLLERVGRLATESMREWLSQEQCNQVERAEAYCLLPDRRIESEDCGRCICSVIAEYLMEHPVLFESEGSLVTNCFVPPYPFYDIWDPDQIAIFAGSDYNAVLCQSICSDYRERLKNWSLVSIDSDLEIVDWFKTHQVPRPTRFDQLIQLWTYILNNHPYWKLGSFRSLKILPVEGMEGLHQAEHLVRVGDSIRGISEDDAAFLSEYLLFFDRSFLRTAVERLKNSNANESQIISDIFQKTNLEKDSTSRVLIERAYSRLNPKYDTIKLIHFAHITGLLNADIPNGFLYVTQDGACRPVTQNLALDISGRLEALLPYQYGRSHLLHEDYLIGLPPERRNQWIEWAESTRSGLCSFVGIVEQSKDIYGTSRLHQWIEDHGGEVLTDDKYPIKRKNFRTLDYDFDPVVLQSLKKLSSDFQQAESQLIWAQVVDLIASDPQGAWKEKIHGKCFQCGNSNEYILSCGALRASWVRRLAHTRCLPDTDGIYREPHELLMRNEKTEPLMGIEPFVRRDYDIKELQDLLLALGVRNTPGSPESVLDRIRIFAGHATPPENELIKLYERLDGLLRHCTETELQTVRKTFAEQRMIYTQEGVWAFPREVFRIIPGGEMPGIFRVLPALQNLALWGRIGVMHEPTGDILLQQIKSLKSGSQIESSERDRVRMILSRESYRIWNETGHWLSLDSVWKPISEYSYFISRNVGAGIDGLYPTVKGQTADLRMIDVKDADALVLTTDQEDLRSALALQVTLHEGCAESRGVKPWMATLGKALSRVRHDDPDEEERMREVGTRIAGTIWTPVTELGVTPYLSGSPAGREQRLEVFWDDRTLYVQKMPFGRLLNVVPKELAKAVSSSPVKDAVVHCYDREPEIVTAYCEVNFTLLPEDAVQVKDPEPDGQADTTVSDSNPVTIHISGTEQDVINKEGDGGIISDNAEPEFSQEDAAENTGSGAPSYPKSSIERPRRHSLIERLAEEQKYQWDPVTHRYVHSDGSWLQKCEVPFHWEMCSPRGGVIGRFWVHDSALSKGIEIPAEVWGMIEKDPRRTAIILRADDDGLDAISGTELLRMVKAEVLGLFPAKFRLRRITE
jgi:hypothetical protein